MSFVILLKSRGCKPEGYIYKSSNFHQEDSLLQQLIGGSQVQTLLLLVFYWLQYQKSQCLHPGFMSHGAFHSAGMDGVETVWSQTQQFGQLLPNSVKFLILAEITTYLCQVRTQRGNRAQWLGATMPGFKYKICHLLVVE